ncbi:unnamed protein product [Dibothriocephalus latus]|uniref:Uncharacterized protein n=1 Tax=Dibothriocephalus latus TaxID=60516 RepID=A0A3P7LSR3_DIBLA|nr:unnamed protein product [Dibothriocephalus latus]
MELCRAIILRNLESLIMAAALIDNWISRYVSQYMSRAFLESHLFRVMFRNELLPVIEKRNVKYSLLWTFRIIRGHSSSLKLENFFELANTTHLRGHPYKDTNERTLLDLRKYFPSQRVVRPCNLLPSETVSADTIAEFKRRLDELRKLVPRDSDVILGELQKQYKQQQQDKEQIFRKEFIKEEEQRNFLVQLRRQELMQRSRALRLAQSKIMADLE